MVMQHWWSPAVLGRVVTSAPLALPAPGVAQLHAPAPVPRELGDAEIAALIAATTDDARLAVVALLIGISAEELVALRWDEIDLSAEAIHVGGETGRVVPLQDLLRSLLVARQRVDDTDAEGTVLHDAQGAPLAIEEVERLILYGAFDAGLDRPQEVTPDTLRYTYLAFLLRQGIRAADIPGVAGYVPHNELAVYMQSNSPKARRPLEHIDRLLPALRELGGRGSDEAPDAIRL
jgi:integrase